MLSLDAASSRREFAGYSNPGPACSPDAGQPSESPEEGVADLRPGALALARSPLGRLSPLHSSPSGACGYPCSSSPTSKKGPCPWTEGAMLCGPGRPGPSLSILSPRPRQGSPRERRAAGCAHPHRGRRQRPTAWQPRWGPSLFQRRRQQRLPRRRLFGACSFLPSDGAHAPPVACRETHGFFPVLGIPLGSGEHGGLGSERPPNPLER